MSEKHQPPLIPMAKDGWRFVAPLLVVAIILLALQFWISGALVAMITVFIGSFFRDFHADSPTDPLMILSPADGHVRSIQEVEVTLPSGDVTRVRRISIVLSIFNAHVQRTPVQGKVIGVKYNPGKFLNAFNDKSSAENENNMIWIQHERGPVGLKQIAGAVARRVICWCKLEEQLEIGERVGLIRFGSRCDTYFPLEAKVRATIGEHVHEGKSILAAFPEA